MLQLRLKKEELLKGVSQTQSIAEKRSSMPILSNLLLEVLEDRLAITATDLEVTFRGTYAANVLENGRFTVPAKKFYEIVRVLGDEEVKIEETENYRLVLTGSRSTYQLNGLAPDDFPPMPDYSDVRFLEIESEKVIDMIDKTIYSIAMEETRYNLAGIYVEKVAGEGNNTLRMVSTDGHRLSLMDRDVSDVGKIDLAKGAIVSRKGMVEIKKLAEANETIKLGFAANSVVAVGENVVIVIRLLEGRFPDYNLVIPQKNDKIMVIGRRDFLEMLRRVSVMSSDDYKGIKFNISPKELTLTAVNPDLGEARESMPVEYEGPEIEAGFNPRYFMDCLGSLKSELISVAMFDGSSPCRVSAPEDEGFIGVIMPMKI